MGCGGGFNGRPIKKVHGEKITASENETHVFYGWRVMMYAEHIQAVPKYILSMAQANSCSKRLSIKKKNAEKID